MAPVCFARVGDTTEARIPARKQRIEVIALHLLLHTSGPDQIRQAITGKPKAYIPHPAAPPFDKLLAEPDPDLQVLNKIVVKDKHPAGR